MTATAATTLIGGTNGTANLAAYEAYLEALKTYDWQVMGIPAEVAELPAKVKTYIQEMREDLGKKVQAVVSNYAADYEGIISTKQGYITATETISATDFIAWVTGASAGVGIGEAITYKEIDGATGIICPMTATEIEAALSQGYMVISRRTDGVIVVEQDINTLVNLGTDKSAIFKKNIFVRLSDEIGNSITRLFENQFIGKVQNNAAGRDLFRQALVKYLDTIQGTGAIETFDDAEITVAQGAGTDSVVVSLGIQPVDAQEKLYMTVEVNG